MKSANTLSKLLVLATLFFGLVWSPGPSVMAYANKTLDLEFVAAGGGPPDVTVLGDGTVIFKITVTQSVSGDLSGTLTEAITQVFPASEEEGLLPITTFWKLETADGTMEGYYSGKFRHLSDGSHAITQHGEVLSVTGHYVDFYQAEVSYRAALGADHMTIAGALTIHQVNRR